MCVVLEKMGWCGKIVFLLLHLLGFFLVWGEEKVVQLNENNWQQMSTDEWMVEFFAPWCPACKSLEPVWKELGGWGVRNNVKIAQIDVTLSPGLSGRFMITALPSIYHVRNGEYRQYKGSRDKVTSFTSFITDKKWEQVEPVSKWKSPNSPLMAIVSYFFKMSQFLRYVHNQLMDEYGLPTWGSYLIFAVVTIMLGSFLGLILVCVIDFIYPPKLLTLEKDGKKKKTDKTSDNELNDEDIKDDLVDDVSKQNERERSNNDEDYTTVQPLSESRSIPNSPNVRKRKSRRAD